MRPSFESSSSNLEHNDSQGNVPTNRGDFNVLQQHLDLVSNRHNTPFDQQRFFVSSQRRYRPAERVGKRELQRISARLKRNREMLDTLSTPQIKYSLARTLTDEEKTAIERMDKVNKAVKAFLGKHLPPEMISTYHRAKAIELWKEQVMQAPSESSLQQVSKLESDLKKASSIKVWHLALPGGLMLEIRDVIITILHGRRIL